MILRAIVPAAAVAVALAWAAPAAAQVDDAVATDFIDMCRVQMEEEVAAVGADLDEVCNCFADYVIAQLSPEDATMLMRAAAATGPDDDFEEILRTQTGMTDAELQAFRERAMPAIGNVNEVCVQ